MSLHDVQTRISESLRLSPRLGGEEITLPDVSEEQMHALAFTADRVRLMRSVLTPSGAEHHVVHEVPLR